MLRQRILTAVVLLAVVVAALLAPTPWPFIVLLSVASGAALWEWLRLTASDSLASVLAGVPLSLGLGICGSGLGHFLGLI